MFLPSRRVPGKSLAKSESLWLFKDSNRLRGYIKMLEKLILLLFSWSLSNFEPQAKFKNKFRSITVIEALDTIS